MTLLPPKLIGKLLSISLSVSAIALISTPAKADIIVNTFCGFSNSTDSTFQDRYFDVYYFDGIGGEPISVMMSSLEVDTLVRLVDARGETVLENDDMQPNDTNSLFTGQIPVDGGYAIVATTYTPYSEGSYHLVAATGQDATSDSFFEEYRVAVPC